MSKKASPLMLYNRASICKYIPEINGIYYLRGIADENSLYPIYYIGRAQKGKFRQQLLEHFLNKDWMDIVYINYVECQNTREAHYIEKSETDRHEPKYNQNETNATCLIRRPNLHLNYSLLN